MEEKHKKVITLGPAAIGKTCLLSYISYNSFNDKTNSTVAVSFFEKTVEVNCQLIKLTMWDTAGQEKYQALNPKYLRGSDTVLICYDPEDPDKIDGCIAQVQEYCPEASVILVATKNDLYSPEKTQLFNNQAKSLQTKYNACDVISVSSKTGDGVAALVNIIATTEMKANNEPINKPVPLQSDKRSCC